MQVKTWASVDDIEVTVEVTHDEVLTEFSDRLEQELNDDREGQVSRHVSLPAIDWSTKLLAKIPDGAIAAFTDGQRKTIADRLKTELKRYETDSA